MPTNSQLKNYTITRFNHEVAAVQVQVSIAAHRLIAERLESSSDPTMSHHEQTHSKAPLSVLVLVRWVGRAIEKAGGPFDFVLAYHTW